MFERGLDRAPRSPLPQPRGPCRHPARGSKRAWNSATMLRGDRRMRAQRRPHVILRERQPHLPQEARDGADQHDVAPLQAGLEHQRVVAVILGDAAHHHQEAAFQRGLAARDRSARRRRSPASCRAARHRRPVACRLDLVGALVHHLEAHILQHRHAAGERDRRRRSSRPSVRRRGRGAGRRSWKSTLSGRSGDSALDDRMSSSAIAGE